MKIDTKHTTLIATIVSAVIAAVIATMTWHAGGCAAEPLNIDGQRGPLTTPQFAELEVVAEAYWGAREVTLPLPVEVYAAPDDPEAAGRGEVGGTRVWIMEPYIPVMHPGRREERYWEKLDLCLIYLHERGHNAGFDHEIFPIMYNPWGFYKTPKCERWAKSEWQR